MTPCGQSTAFAAPADIWAAVSMSRAGLVLSRPHPKLAPHRGFWGAGETVVVVEVPGWDGRPRAEHGACGLVSSVLGPGRPRAQVPSLGVSRQSHGEDSSRDLLPVTPVAYGGQQLTARARRALLCAAP